MRTFEGYKRGVNLGGWLSQCVSREEEHFNQFITKEDIVTIAGWGLDHVRLPLDYDIVVNEDGSFCEKGFSYISNCIGWCKECGLNLILDLHKAKGFMFDEAEVPDPDFFFKDKKLQDEFITLWIRLAKEYGRYHDFVALELLNEVTNPKYCEAWNAIASRAVQVIREYAPKSYIIIGGTCNNSVLKVSQIDVPYDDKIVYTFHCYEPMIFTHQKAEWVRGMTPQSDMDYPATITDCRKKSTFLNESQVGAIYHPCLDGIENGLFNALFREAVEYCDKMFIPIYCGEYGVLDRAPLEDTLAWYKEIHDTFEKYDIGRAAWNYKAKDFGIADSHYDSVRERLIALL